MSRFQQRDAVAYLNEKTGAKGRTLTVLFKFVRGRTEVLTVQRPRIVAALVRALTGRFSPSDSRVRRPRGRKFFLRGAGCRNATPENSRRNFANYLSARRRTPRAEATTTTTRGVRLHVSGKRSGESREKIERWHSVSFVRQQENFLLLPRIL